MKYNIIIPASSTTATRAAIETFTREFGGCTMQSVIGFWNNPSPPVEAVAKLDAAIKSGKVKPNDPGRPLVWAETEHNLLVWAFGPAGREIVLKRLAEEAREAADQDAVMFWTEPGDAQTVTRPAQVGRVQLEPGAAAVAARSLN